VNVCIYVCTNIMYVCMYVHIHISNAQHFSSHNNVWAVSDVHMYIYIYTYIQICISIFDTRHDAATIYIYAHTRVNTATHTHIQMHAHNMKTTYNTKTTYIWIVFSPAHSCVCMCAYVSIHACIHMHAQLLCSCIFAVKQQFEKE
jgi:hypothetical protein